MRLSLDVRRARKGDCLLLHYGDKANPGLVLIDGGPSNVYGPHLKPRLETIRGERKLAGGESLPIDVLMVSHVDDDHIRGILDLTRQEIDAVDARRPRLVNVLDLWHNSFDALISHNSKPLTSSLTAHFGAAAASGDASLSDDAVADVEDEAAAETDEQTEIIGATLSVLASIEQGFRLRQHADRLDYPLNSEWGGDLIVARKAQKPISVSDDLSFTIVGPSVDDLDALRKKHVEWLRKLQKEGKKPTAALAEYADSSVPNLSSLVVLAECEGKRVLLTGDARGDKIIEGLELVGLLKPGGVIDVDILKVPHHGSSNNVASSFFERIRADHYVFSGDGEHGNPERESMEMLFAARGSEPFTIHLTYPEDCIDVERKKNWEKEQAKQLKRKQKNPKQNVREDWSPAKHGIEAFFAQTKLARGQTIVIVDKEEPHVIDLLDRLGY